MTRPNAFPCACTHEAGDSDCAEHPTCNDCGEHLEVTRLWAHANVLAGALSTALRERDAARAECERLRADLAHEREMTAARKIVHRAARNVDRAEDLAAIQRESARVNEQGGVIAHLVGVLREVMRSTTIENARTFVEIALANIEAWHAGAWTPGPSDDAADWKPGHHRERPSPATDKEE